MPEQSLSSKYFCIIVLHDCIPKQQHSPPKAMTAFIVSSARSEAQVIYHIRKLLYQEVTILFSLTRWMETKFVKSRRCSRLDHGVDVAIVAHDKVTFDYTKN